MVFAGNKSDILKINIQSEDIVKVASVRFLGVQLHDKLLWWEQIGVVCNKVTKSLSTLSRIRNYAHMLVILTLYCHI